VHGGVVAAAVRGVSGSSSLLTSAEKRCRPRALHALANFWAHFFGSTRIFS
jgi:hypothetical protein